MVSPSWWCFDWLVGLGWVGWVDWVGLVGCWNEALHRKNPAFFLMGCNMYIYRYIYISEYICYRVI